MFDYGFPKDWSTLKKLAFLRGSGLGGGGSYITLVGDIVRFMASRSAPFRKLQIALEPIQDLHGYDSPWPAGGGANKLPCGEAFTKTANGITLTSDGKGKYTLTGTATANFSYAFDIPEQVLPSTVYVHLHNDKTGSSISSINLDFFNGSTRIDFLGFATTARIYNSTSAMANQTINKLQVRVSSGEAISGTLTFEPMILETSTATTFSPYSNICPISGRTSATVTRAGKNLLNLSEWETESDSGITISTDSIGIINKGYQEFLNRYNVLNRSACVFSFHVKTVALNDSRASFAVYADGTVKLTGSGTAGTGNIELNSVGTEKDITVTVPNGTEYISFGGWAWGGEVQISNLQLELGSTASAYEPYAGNTYTIQLGDTVYGGTVDVTAGTLTVDKAYAVLNDADKWVETSGTTTYYYQNYFDRKFYDDSYTGLICSAVPVSFVGFKLYGRWSAASAGYFGIRDLNGDINLAAVKAMATAGEIAICYEIDPITIPLTPQTINSLVGENNVWDDGTVTVEVKGEAIT